VVAQHEQTSKDVAAPEKQAQEAKKEEEEHELGQDARQQLEQRSSDEGDGKLSIKPQDQEQQEQQHRDRDMPASTRPDNWGPEPGLSQSRKASQLVPTLSTGGGVRIRLQPARSSADSSQSAKPSQPKAQPTPLAPATLPPKPTPNHQAQPWGPSPTKPPPPAAADNTQQFIAPAKEAEQPVKLMQPSARAEPAKPAEPQREDKPTPPALTTLPPNPTPDHPPQPTPPTKPPPADVADQPPHSSAHANKTDFMLRDAPEPSAEAPAWWSKVPEPQQMPQQQTQAALKAPESVTAPQPQPKTASMHVKAPEPTAEAPAWWSKVPEPHQKQQQQPQAAFQATEPVTPPQPLPTAAPKHMNAPEPTVKTPAWWSKVPEPQQKLDSAPKALESVAGPQQPVVAASEHPFPPQPTAVATPQQEPQTSSKAPKHVAAPQQLALAASGHPVDPQPTTEAKPQQEHQTATKATDHVAVVPHPAAAGSGRSSPPVPTPEPQQKPQAGPNTATTAKQSTPVVNVATASAAVRPDAQGPHAEHPVKVPGWTSLWTLQHTRAPSIAQPSYTS
jgi:hypothetical protein